MVQGKANPLLSSFKLSYYTLLNLMRRMEGTGGWGGIACLLAGCLDLASPAC